MLPRVSAALAQFIAPIATAGKQNPSPKAPFERFGSGKKREKEPQPERARDNNVVPFPKPEGSKAQPAPPTAASPAPAGISQALLQLMNLLYQQRASLLRWLGPGVYQSAARQQKRNSRLRKGAILDEKAE